MFFSSHSRSFPPQQLLLAVALLLFLSCWIGACAPDKPSGQAAATQPLSVAAVPSAPAIPDPPKKAKDVEKDDETDYGCSYFYFLWGQHAELEGKHEAALEAYEKALICDPEANFVINKLPQLLLRLNRSEEAIARIKEHLEGQPADLASRMLLAKIFIRSGKFQDAADQYRKVHELNPSDTSPLLLLSEVYLAENKQEMARKALQDVLAADSRSYAAHLLLARLLVGEGKFEQAQEHYQQALETNPTDGLRLELADVLVQQKNYAKAIKTYQELLTRDELNEEARIALIHVYLLQNKGKKAMAELNRLKELASNPERADLTIAKLYIRWEEYDKAMALLRDILKQDELSEARYMLAVLCVQAKRHEEALSILKKLGPDAEEHEDGIILQVRALRELNRHAEAAKLLESILAEQKQLSPDIYVLLADVYQQSEQNDACEKTFVRALEVHPDDEQLLYEYGLFLDYADKKQQALAVMEKLIDMNPDHAGALNYVGYALAEGKKNLNKAFLLLSRAKELKPDNAYIHDSLGWVYYQMGNLEEALRSLEQAASLAPSEPAILAHLAEVHQSAGRTEEALKTWRKALELLDGHSSKETSSGKKERDDRERKRMEEKINCLVKQEESK